MSRANMDPVIVRSATPDDRRAIERLLRDLPDVWQASWRKDVVARALGASDDLAFVAVRDCGLRDRRLLVSPCADPVVALGLADPLPQGLVHRSTH